MQDQEPVKVCYDSAAPPEFQFTVVPDLPALKAAVDAIRHWPSKPDLVEFAAKRHGYADSNGYFGVTYPQDLDEYDVQHDGRSIPDGYVEVYAWYGDSDGPEYIVREAQYLEVLQRFLEAADERDLADQVGALVTVARRR